MNGHVILHGLMFNNLFFSPFVDVIVRAKEYVLPHIFDVVVMHVLVKEYVFGFIGRRCTKNWIVLCDSHQDWF